MSNARQQMLVRDSMRHKVAHGPEVMERASRALATAKDALREYDAQALVRTFEASLRHTTFRNAEDRQKIEHRLNRAQGAAGDLRVLAQAAERLSGAMQETIPNLDEIANLTRNVLAMIEAARVSREASR